MSAAEPLITIGSTWQHRRENWRRVVVTDVSGDDVYVARNTSRRRQSLLRATLLRNYRPIGST